MNSKCRIQKVILINWKGMFFQPFDIDPGMTILEGANGTGKTTIMVGVYTCLMPDLNYLSFQNVTVSSSRKNEDKGLYGRLGQDEKNQHEPIFSVLDVITAEGVRHLVGVQLIKKTYPQISLKHFAIKNLDKNADVEKLLIKYNEKEQQQEIPELEEIGANCLKYQGELVHFRHAKDYFRFLFDNGISPVRLLESEERKQYNQLLNTSLYGGLSRSLQTSLREYLLPEDNKLISGIRDMEQNLLTCRRTRSSIQRYQTVRETIRGIYQTGLEMFSFAFFANRLNSEMIIKKALEVRKDKHKNRRLWDELAAGLAKVREETLQYEDQLRQSLLKLETAREKLDKHQSAFNISQEIESKQKEREKQGAVEQEAKQAYMTIKEEDDASRTQERKLGSRHSDVARKLADAGKAWQSLSEQVGLYRQAEKLLTEARELLESKDLNEDNIAEWLQKMKSTFQDSKDTCKQAHESYNETKLRHEHFYSYHQLLEKLTGESIPLKKAGQRAEQEIEEFADLVDKIKKSETIPGELETLEEKIKKRQAILDVLKEADLEDIKSSADLEKSWHQLLEESKSSEEKREATRLSINQKNQEIQKLENQLPDIKKRLETWESFHTWKKQLEDRTAQSITNSVELANLRMSLDSKLQKSTLEKFRLEGKRERCQTEFQTLMNEGSVVPGLKKLTEDGFGTLLSDRYEDIPEEWSANLEGRLGPLTNALVVKNAQTVADDLMGSFDRPDDVWMVEEDMVEKLPESREISDSILVKHGDAWRLSRMPEVPVLGKKARNKKIAFLRDEVQKISQELEKNAQNIKGIQKSQDLLNKIVPNEDFLTAESPVEQLEVLNSKKPELKQELEKLNSQEEHLQKVLKRIKAKLDVLQTCFVSKELLDLSELESHKKDLQSELEEIKELRVIFKQKEQDIPTLKKGQDVLQQPPDDNLEEFSQALKTAQSQEVHFRTVTETLQRLFDSREHFQYADQVPLLQEKKSLNKHLEEQLETIEKEQQTLGEQIDALTVKLKEAGERSHKEEMKLLTLQGQIKQLEEELTKLAVSGSEEELEAVRDAAEAANKAKDEIEALLNKTKENRYRLEAEASRVQEEKTKAENRLEKQQILIKPALQAWRMFRQQAIEDKKLERLMADYYAKESTKNKRPELFWRRVSASRATLVSSLEKMKDTKMVLDRIKAVNMEETDPGEDCLNIWRQIHGYLNQVIPVDLQTSDPEKAQEIINKKLESLWQSLEQHELNLRGHVQNIPSHINAEIRKQKSRIRKLNQKLESTRFGFLQSIRINVETHPELKRFLDILPQQLDIFAETNEENISIEALMANLYEKEGAGKVKGDLLLDYRHYVRMNIEVKREGSQDYEKVTSTNLSTGESIGVGIAVLIIVLMSWEEQSNLMRPDEKRSSLRFLLLDESSRLDQKALYTLTDFCDNLNLQLLIAAPQVERTLRGTTHHLTRGYFDGREEVIVRGRRLSVQNKN